MDAKAPNSLHYLELCEDPIRFDAHSQLTNVFFDDSNKQIFAVRSGGTTGVVVKGPTLDSTISFILSEQGVIRSIKFSPDNKLLAVQRSDTAVEFMPFVNGQPSNGFVTHQSKQAVYGFVWLHQRECALFSSTGIEVVCMGTEKLSLKTLKYVSISMKWFAWCAEANIALCYTPEGNIFTPVLVKQKCITKLAKLDLGNPNREVSESKVTLGQVYGTAAVLILETARMEVEVYLLNGPGLAPRKCHVLRLAQMGRFAISIVDNLIAVHHQASATSAIYDIALEGDISNEVTYHSPIVPARSIRPFALKLPSLPINAETKQVDLYSTNWVLFQPNVVIDARLGCMWYLTLCIQEFGKFIPDRVRLTAFLLQRSTAKAVLVGMLRRFVDEEYNGTRLPVLETIFNKINAVYGAWVLQQLQLQCAQPLNAKISQTQSVQPRLLIDQEDMVANIFSPIKDTPQAEPVLMQYLQSLIHNKISAQETFTKFTLSVLLQNGNFETMRNLLSRSLLLDNKAVACQLLAMSKPHVEVAQMAFDMLHKIKAHDIIIEVYLERGHVIEALRYANSLSVEIAAPKYLEAALKTENDTLYKEVFEYFFKRSTSAHGTAGIFPPDQCDKFVRHYNSLLANASAMKPTINKPLAVI